MSKTLFYLTPELAPILYDTYGAIVYQEQVQEIFVQLAGYSVGQADMVRRYMSKKEEDKLKTEKLSFIYGDPDRKIKGCVAKGIQEDVAGALFCKIESFAMYAFNKSHAASYAVLSYQTAWLKFHYPVQYLRAALDHMDFEQYSGIIMDLKKIAHIHIPDVNRSDSQCKYKGKDVWLGLGIVKGLGVTAQHLINERKAGGVFESLGDFMCRVRPGKKLILSLTNAGVLDSLCANRAAILDLADDYLDIIKKIEEIRVKIQALSKSESKKLMLKLRQLEDKGHQLKPNLDICEDKMQRLKSEKELLGEYISGHPMDLYAPKGGVNSRSIIEEISDPMENRTISVVGVVSNFAEKFRKKDGAKIGFFTLSDKTGEIEVCCFSKEYKLFQNLLINDAAVKVTGKFLRKDEGEKKELYVNTVEKLILKKDIVIVYVNDITEWERCVMNLVKPYVTKHGNPVVVYDLLLEEPRICEFKVAPAILRNKSIQTSLIKMCG